MRKEIMCTLWATSLLGGTMCTSSSASEFSRRDLEWAIKIAEEYPFQLTNITYYTVENYDVKLDVIMNTARGKSRPTLMYIHGGAWSQIASKDAFQLASLPFVQLGWNVVNVDYRPTNVALAPAAVEDCLCALRWIEQNARRFDIDENRLVIMGASVGGLLALTTGMIPRTDVGLGRPCALTRYFHSADWVLGVSSQTEVDTPVTIRPAAIINWSGIADVADLLEGANRQEFALAWLGGVPDRVARAKDVSPLSYVREGLPPVITIHGDSDRVVPYKQAVRLHEALTAAHVANELVTVPGRGHGPLGWAARRDAYLRIMDFLKRNRIETRP